MLRGAISFSNAFIKSLGVALIVFFILLVILIFYSYIFDICKLYHLKFKNYYLTIFLMSFGIYIAFNIVFNFILACSVSPGTTQELEPDFSQLSDQELDNLRARSNMNLCKKCHRTKPIRTHHCSICNKCIYKMDHHCPWINNCVGHQNQRYFLLVVMYLLVGTGWMSLLFSPILLTQQFIEYKYERSGAYNIVSTLVLVLFVILFFFSGWNWFLGCKGYTAIEFWGKKLPEGSKKDVSYDFGSKLVRENLYQTFGTKSIFMLLLPSIRELPQDGSKWQLNPNKDEEDDAEIDAEIVIEQQ